MGLRNLFSHAKIRNVWNAVKRGVATVYNPIKTVVGGVARVSHWIDGALDKATQWGVPASVVDLLRDNPIYSTIHDVIEFADDLVEKDLPRLGGSVENFIEHNILQSHGIPNIPRAVSGAHDIIQAAQGVSQSISNRPSFGFTPNRGASSRQVVTGGSAVS